MVLYHSTASASVGPILRDGFRDAEGSYMLVGLTLRGVFLSDVPLDENEGATAEALLMVDVPADLNITDYELIEDDGAGKGYREWCVPASLLNSRCVVRLLKEDEVDRAWRARWER